MIKIYNDIVKLDTETTSVIIKKMDGKAFLLHCGKKLKDYENYDVFSNGWWESGISNDDKTLHTTVLGSVGEYTNREPFCCFYDERGVFSNRFEYVGAEIVSEFSSPFPTSRKKGETCKLTFVDEISGAKIYQYYTVFSDSSIIATHSEFDNCTDKTLTVTRLSSLQLDYVGDKAKVTTYDGTWVEERIKHETEVVSGNFEINSKTGISSAIHNPFFTAKINDRVLGFNLIFSGNHKEIVEVSPYNRIRILTGMSDFNFRYILKGGDKLVSPEAIFTVAESETEVSCQMHKFVLNHIINPDFAYKERPILINNWEGTFFDFTGEKIYEIAKIASSIGIEMMVLDDGWFGKRDDDKGGLGDWYDNVKKTGGLKKLADKIHKLGMKFGLWVEPEMISEDSNLYRKHSEYAMKIPNVKPLERRTQLCIDLCNDEVSNYLADTLIKLFNEVGVDYVKWDHNRSMSDVYSPSLTNQGEYFYKYYVNQCAMLDKIISSCKNVLFEACASGGCRFDLGMLYYMPQCWGSDNTNAYDRLFIQEGTLAGYPQSTMGSHVAGFHHTLPFVSYESMFNCACVGAFGYEFDITKASKKDLEIIENQVEFYKKYRSVLQFGTYYRLGESLLDSVSGGWITVSDDKSVALAVIIDRQITRCEHRPHFVFTGLDENALYKVESRKQFNVEKQISFTAYGDALCSYGVDVDDIKNETDQRENSCPFYSRILVFTKIK